MAAPRQRSRERGLAAILTIAIGRREVIGGLLFAAVARRAQAQQPAKPYRIAVVSPSNPVTEMKETSSFSTYRALFGELRRLGYVEGQNLIIERYSGQGNIARYPELAREVVQQKPDLILAATSRMVQNLKAATTTIPIVGLMADPVAFGLVSSLARPGGNITGVSSDAGLEVWGKRLGLLREAVPTVARVGYLASLDVAGSAQGAAMREAARQAEITLVGRPLEGVIQEAEYRRVFQVMTQEHADGLIVSDQGEHVTYSRLIIDLAEKSRLPALFPYRGQVELGGLMAYGIDNVDYYRRATGYIDRILKGAKPSELPVDQATKFELVINMKAAKAIGLSIPPALLLRADEVIE